MDILNLTPGAIASNVWATTPRTLTQQPGLFYGYTFQAPSVASAISMIATGTTTVLTYTGNPGAVLQVGFVVSTTISAGTPSAQLNITLDSVSHGPILIYVTSQGWYPPTKSTCAQTSGTGGSVGDFLNYMLYCGFAANVTIAFQVTQAASTAGAITVTASCMHS